MRKPLKQSTKNEVLFNQRNECAGCEKPLDIRIVNFDHRCPLSQGGTDDPSNIQALCPKCHAKKTRDDRMRENDKRNHHTEHSTNKEPENKEPSINEELDSYGKALDL